MTRASLVPASLLWLLLPATVAKAQPHVTVSTTPKSFSAGETVKIDVEIANTGTSIGNARLELQVGDGQSAFLIYSENIGAIGPNEKKTHTSPSAFKAPKAPKGNFLEIRVSVKEETTVPTPVGQGVRRLIYHCKSPGDAKNPKTGRITCSYKTPAQLAIEKSS